MFYKNTFMKEFLSGEMISDEDAKVLIRAYQNGYTSALEPLIRGFSKLIIYFIPMEIRFNEHGDDWFQDGVVTVIKCANEFNTESNTKFSTYLSKALKNNFVKSSHLFSLPCYLWKYVSSYKKLIEIDPNISDLELMEELNISSSFLNTVKEAVSFASSSSVDDYIGVNKLSYEEDIAPKIIEQIDYSICSKTVFESLDNKTVDIIKKRYGFYEDEYTLEKIGKDHQMTRQGIDILIQRTFKKMKNKKVLKDLAKEYLG